MGESMGESESEGETTEAVAAPRSSVKIPGGDDAGQAMTKPSAT